MSNLEFDRNIFQLKKFFFPFFDYDYILINNAHKCIEHQGYLVVCFRTHKTNFPFDIKNKYINVGVDELYDFYY